MKTKIRIEESFDNLADAEAFIDDQIEEHGENHLTYYISSFNSHTGIWSASVEFEIET